MSKHSSKKNSFTSKAIAEKIFKLFEADKSDLAKKFLDDASLSTLKHNIISLLRKKLEKKENYLQTKVFSDHKIQEDILESLGVKIDTKNHKYIATKDLGPGVIIINGDQKMDATLSGMIENQIIKILETK